MSLKCLAKKGFIPCLEWKSPRPKQILDPKLYLGSLEYYGFEKILCPKNIFEEKNLEPKKIVALKIFVGPKQIFEEKKLWPVKIFLGLKKILGQKHLCLKNLVQKNVIPQK